MNEAAPSQEQPPAGAASRSSLDAERFKRVMRNIASSVAVITVEHQGRMHGMTATAICSVSSSPPSILIVVNRSTRSHPIITEAGKFTVNVLAEHQAELGSRFSEKHGSPFDGVGHRAGIYGGPVLEDTAAYVECETQAEIDAGTHTIFIGTVMAGDVTRSPPLLFHEGEYKSLFGLASGVKTTLENGEAACEFEQAKREND